MSDYVRNTKDLALQLEFLLVDGHKIVNIDLEKDTDFLAKVETQARMKAAYVHKDDPKHRKRSEAEIVSQNFLGTLADTVSAHILERYFEKYGYAITVERYDDVRTDDYRNPDLYDLKLRSNNVDKVMEIRSSVCNRIPVVAMVRKWQILGPYTSEIKKTSETAKPFYMRILYHYTDFQANRNGDVYDKSCGMDYIKEGKMKMYYVGGSPLSLLLERGRNEKGYELKQESAEYVVLDIKDGLNAIDFLHEVASSFFSQTEDGGR